MEAEQDLAASVMTVDEARGAGAYLAESDTYATLVAAATLAGSKRASLCDVVTDRQFALTIGQFVLAAEYRAGRVSCVNWLTSSTLQPLWRVLR